MGTILSGSVAVKLASECVDLIEGSGLALVVEGCTRLKPGMESGVEISSPEGQRRLRGRIVSCEIVGLSPIGPRFRIVLVLNAPFDVVCQHHRSDVQAASETPLLSAFDIVTVELGDPDPAFAGNSW